MQKVCKTFVYKHTETIGYVISLLIKKNTNFTGEEYRFPKFNDLMFTKTRNKAHTDKIKTKWIR